MTIHSQFIHLSLKYMWLICIQTARIISNAINLNTVIAYRCHRRRKGESGFHTSFGARQYQQCTETYWPASTVVKSKAPDNTLQSLKSAYVDFDRNRMAPTCAGSVTEG
jgi:hypothetical protein